GRVGAVEVRVVPGEVERGVGEEVVSREDAGPAVDRGAPGELAAERLRIGKAAIVVVGVDLRGLEDLAEVVGVDGPLGFLADAADGGDDDGGENADDGDDGEQFD